MQALASQGGGAEGLLGPLEEDLEAEQQGPSASMYRGPEAMVLSEVGRMGRMGLHGAVCT